MTMFHVLDMFVPHDDVRAQQLDPVGASSIAEHFYPSLLWRVMYMYECKCSPMSSIPSESLCWVAVPLRHVSNA